MSFDVAAARAQFPILRRQVNGHPLVYLDNAASAQKPRAVIEAMTGAMENSYANVHRGLHTLANETTEAYEAAREAARRLLGAASTNEIIFTKGATEAINLVAASLGRRFQAGDEIVLTEMEHHANIVPWHFLRERAGVVLKFAPISDDGVLDMAALIDLIGPRTCLVAASHMSNVLGTINPVREIIAAAHAAGALALIDGCQAVVHGKVDVQALDADFYVFSGHKLYGPTGIGALWGRLDLLRAMPPFMGGGSMIRKVTRDGTTYADPPARFEAGTPAIAQAIGMASALRWLDGLGMEAVLEHERGIADYALERLPEVPGLRIFGPPRGPERVGPVSFELEGIHAHDVSEILDRHGVAVRAGHHCAQVLMDRLGVVATARASFGVYTIPEEIDRLVEGLHDARKVFGL
jgi:cysteine desulfurase/selenocysteine lyase